MKKSRFRNVREELRGLRLSSIIHPRQHCLPLQGRLQTRKRTVRRWVTAREIERLSGGTNNWQKKREICDCSNEQLSKLRKDGSAGGDVLWCGLSDVNECEIAGVCDQMCTNLPGSYKCSCHAGYKISYKAEDTAGRVPGKCRAMGGDPLVLLTDKHNIRQFDIVNKMYLPLSAGSKNAVAMDYHITNRV